MRGNAFFLQYISLMLIVICMIVATDSTPSLETPKIIKTVEKQPALYSLTEQQFADLFAVGSAEIQKDTFEVLTTLLHAHDLTAEVEIGSLLEEQFPLVVARTVSLHRALLERGLPAEALQIRAQLASDAESISVDLKREERP